MQKSSKNYKFQKWTWAKSCPLKNIRADCQKPILKYILAWSASIQSSLTDRPVKLSFISCPKIKLLTQATYIKMSCSLVKGDIREETVINENPLPLPEHLYHWQIDNVFLYKMTIIWTQIYNPISGLAFRQIYKTAT